MAKHIYDEEKEKLEFDKKIAKLEKKLTKANQKGKAKKKEVLEEEVKDLILERLSGLSQFLSLFSDFGGYKCKYSIEYDDSGKANISCTFEKSELKCVTGEELSRILDNKSLNHAKETNTEKEPVRTPKEKGSTNTLGK